MNDLSVFKNDEFGEVRTLLINGNIYFVGNDIAKCLGYDDQNGAIKRHCEDPLKQRVVDSNGKQRDTNVIPESDVYSLIFGSKLPNAKKFKTWVTKEVLPSIRKTGQYTLTKPMTEIEMIERMLEDAKQKEALKEDNKCLDTKRFEANHKHAGMKSAHSKQYKKIKDGMDYYGSTTQTEFFCDVKTALDDKRLYKSKYGKMLANTMESHTNSGNKKTVTELGKIFQTQMHNNGISAFDMNNILILAGMQEYYRDKDIQSHEMTELGTDYASFLYGQYGPYLKWDVDVLSDQNVRDAYIKHYNVTLSD